jgi:aryl-alcohol dehydrogenase-like predicted oxidoreductase
MANREPEQTDRRAFLQAGTLATATAATVIGSSAALAAQQGAQPSKPGTTQAAVAAPVMPTRKLGKSGVEITILDQGAVRSPDRVLRTAFAQGIRVFDTAKVYGTEPRFKVWFEADSSIRKQIFLVTKDMPVKPESIPKLVDERLVALGTDYIDLFFVHGLGDDSRFDPIQFLKSPEFKTAADKIRKSGKARLFGFSTHHKNRAAIIQAAAESGVVDAIMLQYTPWLDKGSALNKALDACWKKGIGLISMKQIAGNGFGDKPKGDILKDVFEKVPALKQRNLTPFQGLLQAIWTDERITSACVSMKNTDQIRENVDAAKRYEPLKAADIHELRDALLAHGPTMCADCEGRCSLAAGTTAELGNLTRFLTYHQHHGDRAEARRQYAAMAPEARDWSNADLEAARAACPNGLNFAKLLPQAEKLLA